MKIKKILNKRYNLENPFHTTNHSVIDLFSYEGLRENEDYLKIDNQYVRCLYIVGYPFVAVSGWLDNLINFGYNSDISYHIQEVPSSQALPKLNRKITELESTKRTMLRDGKIIGSEVTDPLQSAIELRDKILRGQQKLFQLSIYIGLRANSIQALNKMSSIFESVMASKLFYTKTARYQQLDALKSILPRAQNNLSHQRNLDSSSLALTFPFMSSDFVQPSGVLYGINKSNSSLVMVDRFSLPNANSIIFAQSGSGKSYLTKVEIIRQLNDGTKVIVIDPEGEYKKLTESLGGTYVKVSVNSKQKINPFDSPFNSLGKKDKFQFIQDLTSFIEVMAEGLKSSEKAIVDKILLDLYSRKRKTPPLLGDFYLNLKKYHYNDLLSRLEKYVTGSLSELFNYQTNISLDNRLIVFGIKDLSESIRPIMMFMISNFVSNSIKQNKRKQILIIDEGWLLFENPTSAKFISGLVRRARKHYLGISIITQQANDFLNNSYGRIVASQSMLRILMRQDSTSIDQVQKAFSLSEYERDFLLCSDRGEALMIIDQTHLALKIVSSKKEHPLITTDPSELCLK